MWKRKHDTAIEVTADEKGRQHIGRTYPTASHLDSTTWYGN
jgi:hypothetical protein